MLQLFCLCTPQLHRTTEASPVHLTPKAMALFVCLAVTQRLHSRDVLADLIYGTPTSLEIGVIAGVFGVTIGALMVCRLRAGD